MSSSVANRIKSSARLLQRGATLANPFAKLGMEQHGLACSCVSCKVKHPESCSCSACGFAGFQVVNGRGYASSATGNRGVIFMGADHVEVKVRGKFGDL